MCMRGMWAVIDVDGTVVHWAEREFIGAVATEARMRIVRIQIRATMDVIDTIRDETAEIEIDMDMDIVDGAHQSPAMTAMESKYTPAAVQRNVIYSNRVLSISSEQVNYRNQKPSNKIIVLGLAKHLTEADVSDSILFLFITWTNTRRELFF